MVKSCKKKNKPVDEFRFRRIYPFRSHYLNLNGLRYHFIDEGIGEPIIMVHGNPTWSFYFRELIKGLSDHYRIIAPDHIGCGLSDKPDTTEYDFRLKSRIDDLEALLDYLKLKQKITLVLHDWGGIIGMAYALRHPEKIGRIVLLNTAAFLPPNHKKLPLRLQIIRTIRPLATVAVLGFNLFAYAAVLTASYKRLSNTVRSGLTAPYNCWKNRIATLKFVQDIPLNAKDPSYSLVKYVDDNLSKLTDKPMLICWGQHDFVFDADYLAEWQRRFPNAQTHIFPNAGHYVLEDEPEKIKILLKDFLQNTPI
ncbi:MAG: alpha/beta fold hydrolase [Desulfobacterales bacterium]|nr:alpha/beta fold hydrolase [Desulfobacterales bacterium]